MFSTLRLVSILPDGKLLFDAFFHAVTVYLDGDNIGAVFVDGHESDLINDQEGGAQVVAQSDFQAVSGLGRRGNELAADERGCDADRGE